MSNKPFLLNEEKLSRWAYLHCRDKKDDPEIRKFITDSYWAYKYCMNLKDDPKVRKYITEQPWLHNYKEGLNITGSLFRKGVVVDEL